MRNLVALFASVGLTACVAQNEPPPLDKIIPTSDDVAIKLPSSASQKASAVGDLAQWYVVTRDVTKTLNAGTAWVLIVVHAVVQYPPTTVAGDTYTWGPWSGALDPAEYELTATGPLPDGSYDWQLEGRSKITAGAQLETVISGNGAEGHGTFTIDFDAAERVNPVDNNAQGQVAVAYDLVGRRLQMGIDNLQGHFDYDYSEATDGGGNMVFESIADTDDPGTQSEDSVIRSRWLSTGDGRADVRISGGDLGTVEVTGSQCWDA